MSVVRFWYLTTFGSFYCRLLIVLPFFFFFYLKWSLNPLFLWFPLFCVFHFARHSLGFVTSCHRMLCCCSALEERPTCTWVLSKLDLFCMYGDNKLPSCNCAQLTLRSCASVPVDRRSICLTARVFHHTWAAALVCSSHGWGYNALGCSSLLASLIFKWASFTPALKSVLTVINPPQLESNATSITRKNASICANRPEHVNWHVIYIVNKHEWNVKREQCSPTYVPIGR